MNRNRRVAGWLAKRNGQQFENYFETRLKRLGLTVVRIPDSCKQIGPNHRDLIRIKSPFDWIIGANSWVIFCDTKSFDSDRLTYSQIDKNQLKNLENLSKHTTCGYIIHFRPSDVVGFFDAKKLSDLKPRGSYHYSDSVQLGSLASFDLSAMILK